MKKIIITTVVILIAIILLLTILLIDKYKNNSNNDGTQTLLNNDKSLELIVSESGTKNITKITVGDLSNKYDYDIYYFGLESVYVRLADKTVDLKEALLTYKITMEEIIEKAETISGLIYNSVYRDGGSKIYKYETYTIIKKHTLDGNNDVYIGIPEMRLSGESVTGDTD
ncbi:MAG: hypothetical protein FWF46_05975 [Oscillospiraceae bacterium]|nr:hypothetical protein [Oscillospiraceae bacterium]